VIAALLQAGEPLTLTQLVDQCGIPEGEVFPILRELVYENRVVQGHLLPDKLAPQYCWKARWEKEAQRRAVSSEQRLRAVIGSVETVPGYKLDVDSEPALAFYGYVMDGYQPPKDKRFLVFLQCSVRRPFSSSPSHASMRRAISVATDYDPRKDFESCPVHVVVLASKIGPVPYELEDVYPANVRGGGVRHLSGEHYARVKPILAGRMAQYLLAHGSNYERFATFTRGRYAEVMKEARRIAADRCGETLDIAVLPDLGGPRIVRMGQSTPRQYWARHWIQLYLEIVSWLEPAQQAQAEARLRAMRVDYRESDAFSYRPSL